MRKLLAAIFAGLFALSMTAPVLAQDKKDDKQSAKKKDDDKKKKKDEAKK